MVLKLNKVGGGTALKTKPAPTPMPEEEGGDGAVDAMEAEIENGGPKKLGKSLGLGGTKKASPTGPKVMAQPAAKQGGGLSFMRTGAAAKQKFDEHRSKVEAEKAERSKAWRFRIHQNNLGDDFLITFLDGDLGSDGELILNSWEEHTMNIGGKFQQYVCLQSNDPNEYCPMCAAQEKKSPVAVFTVIDHTEYVIQKGDRKGQISKDNKRLFVAKDKTVKQLMKVASKVGGLRGIKMEVSRSTDQSPSVGDLFTPIEQYTVEEMRELFGQEEDPKTKQKTWKCEPFDYGKEAPYFTAEKLKEMGVGITGHVVGSESDVGGGAQKYL